MTHEHSARWRRTHTQTHTPAPCLCWLSIVSFVVNKGTCPLLDENVTGVMRALFWSKHILTAGATAHRTPELLRAFQNGGQTLTALSHGPNQTRNVCEVPPSLQGLFPPYPSPPSCAGIKVQGHQFSMRINEAAAGGTVANDMQRRYVSSDWEPFHCNYPEPEVV